MNIKPIHSEADLRLALGEVSRLMDRDPAPGTPDGDRLDILSTLIEAYEEKHFPIESPEPLEAIRFRMEQEELTIRDLVPSIGNANRVYEVLNGTRPLTLRMIRNLHAQLDIPAEVLIRAS